MLFRVHGHGLLLAVALGCTPAPSAGTDEHPPPNALPPAAAEPSATPLSPAQPEATSDVIGLPGFGEVAEHCPPPAGSIRDGYTELRRCASAGLGLPAPEVIDLDRFVNRFRYGHERARERPCTLITEIASLPWSHAGALLYVAVDAEPGVETKLKLRFHKQAGVTRELGHMPADARGVRLYQITPSEPVGESARLAQVDLRCKGEDGQRPTLRRATVRSATQTWARASADFRWAAGVAALAMVLAEDPDMRAIPVGRFAKLARSAASPDPDGRRAEHLELVDSLNRVGVYRTALRADPHGHLPHGDPRLRRIPVTLVGGVSPAGPLARAARSLFSARHDEFLACYELGLGRDAQTGGRFRVQLELATDGHVRSVVLDQARGGRGLEDPQLNACLRSSFADWSLPASDVAGVDALELTLTLYR
jgi:hypothetical protein